MQVYVYLSAPYSKTTGTVRDGAMLLLLRRPFSEFVTFSALAKIRREEAPGITVGLRDVGACVLKLARKQKTIYACGINNVS